MSRLTDLIGQLAVVAEQEGIVASDMDNGKMPAFVRATCDYREGTMFDICFLLACELADRAAQREGYKSQGDRAATLAFAKCRK